MYKVLIVLLLSGCAALTDFALDAVSPDKGGINTELVVGDKEQVLGTNQEVKANEIGKVVGTSDNSVTAASIDRLAVTNQNYPAWLIVLLLAGNVLFLCLPTPTTMMKYWRKRNASKN